MTGARLFFRTILATLALVAPALSGCSTLGLFNAIAPKDSGTTIAARNLAYGPEPRQKLDVYAPAKGIKPAGIVVFVYGGSWNSGSKSDYGFAGRALAARGYVTAVFDYRLVPQIRYPGFIEDAAKAVAWAHLHAADYGADPRKLYLIGHSAGAYNAMMVTLAPQFLAREGLAPSDVTAVVGLSGPYDFLPLGVSATQEAFAGVDNLAATQPINLPRRARATPPIMLATGDADETVQPRNTKALAAALRSTGHAVEEKYYTGLGHVDTLLALSRPMRGKAPVIDDVATFFAAH